MNSSMMRCAMLRTLRTMLSMRPSSSNSMIGSGRSKSIEPRAHAPLVQQQRQFLHAAEIARPAARSARVISGSPSSTLWTLVYVMRSAERITPGVKSARTILPARVHFHDHAHHQPVDFRIQRADAVGKLLGQHGHGAIRKINGSAAQARFAIERRTARARNAPRPRCAPAVRSGRSAARAT